MLDIGSATISERGNADGPCTVDVSGLTSGTYLLELTNGSERFAQRIVVMR